MLYQKANMYAVIKIVGQLSQIFYLAYLAIKAAIFGSSAMAIRRVAKLRKRVRISEPARPRFASTPSIAALLRIATITMSVMEACVARKNRGEREIAMRTREKSLPVSSTRSWAQRMFQLPKKCFRHTSSS